MMKAKMVFLGLLMATFTACNSSLPTSGSSSSSSIEDIPMESGSDLHYVLPANEYEFPFIGDVHPFYDEKTSQWFLFYLDTSGTFNSKLLVSADGLNWKPKDITISSGYAKYAVLNVFEKDGQYWSYYADYQSSVSTNLVDWGYAGSQYKIPQDRLHFPGGSRDPSVVYDEDSGHYYSIAINYESRLPNESTSPSNLAIEMSVGSDQSKWNPVHRPVFAQALTNHDYECPQIIKMGDRWYVFASRYGDSVHGVGKLSYFIGDAGVNPYEVDWATKKEYYLSTEDLCAAQVAKKGNEFYMFGWVPRYAGNGTWGGYVSLPVEVYALADGTLASRLSKDIEGKVRGGSFSSLSSPANLLADQTVSLFAGKNRLDAQGKIAMSENSAVEIKSVSKAFVITISNSPFPKVTLKSGATTCFSTTLRSGELDAENDIRVIIEDMNIDIFINDKYVLNGRLENAMNSPDTVKITCLNGQIGIPNFALFRLKYLEEI